MSKESDGFRKNYYFLTSEEVSFFECFCSLVIPSGDDPKADPGAHEVGTVHYIDSTLFGFPKPVQDYFRESLCTIEAISKDLFLKSFCDLREADRNIVFRAMFLDPKTRERAFDLRSLALEGFYSDYHDPWYDGISGWEVVGFSGKRISDIKKDWSFLKVWKEWKEK